MVFIMFEYAIPFNMVDNEDYLLAAIFMNRMEPNDKVCLKPSFLSKSEKEDEFYERIKFEKAFCDIYEKIEHPEEVFIEVRQAGGVTVDGKFVWIYEDVPLAMVKEVHDKIKLFTADIKNSSLSPFEKTMALYMIATHFIDSDKGDGKDADGKIIDSSVMHILSDDDDGYKIQCAGYTDLFCRMAYECGIHTKEMQMNWDDSTAAHSVAIVDLDDEKYGIHGSFICDVRGESDFQEVHQQRVNVDNYNGFNYFCLPFRDFDAMSKVFTNVSKTRRYAINNIEITGEEDKYISNERMKSSDIFIALNHLYKFIFENDGKRPFLKEDDFNGIFVLDTIRGRIDEANKTRVSNSSSHK